MVPTWCKWRPTSQVGTTLSLSRASTRHGRSIQTLVYYWKKKNRYSLPTFKRSGNQNKNTNKTSKQKQKNTKNTNKTREPENTKGDWSCDLILIRLVAWCFLYVFDSHLSLGFWAQGHEGWNAQVFGKISKVWWFVSDLQQIDLKWKMLKWHPEKLHTSPWKMDGWFRWFFFLPKWGPFSNEHSFANLFFG